MQQPIPDHRDELLREIASIAPRTADRGRRYAERGRVTSLVVERSFVGAIVQGTEPYETKWTWAGDGWVPECSCPVGFYCKHAVALACCALALNRERLQPRPLIESVVPHQVVVSTSRFTAGATGRRPADPRVERRHERETRASMALVDRLRASRSPWERQMQLQVLLGRSPVANLAYSRQLAAILAERDPDLLCWRLAAEIASASAGWVPPGLAPYRDRQDLATRFANREHDVALGELIGWAGRHTTAASRSLRLAFGLATAWDHRAVVTLEVRLTSARLDDAPRSLTQLQQLRSEIMRAPGIMAPEQALILEWLTDGAVALAPLTVDPELDFSPAVSRTSIFALRGPTLSTILGRLSDASVAALATWSGGLDRELAARAGIAGSDVVRLKAEPVRLVPACTARAGAPWLELVARWSNGRERPIADVLYLRAGEPSRSSGLLLAEGAFWPIAEEPPQPVVERLAALGGVSVPADRCADLLRVLTGRFEHLREALRPHTRVHPVRPVVTFDLRDDEWLRVRLLACACGDELVSPERDLLFEYAKPGRWERFDSGAVEACDPLTLIDPGSTAASPSAPSTGDDKNEDRDEHAPALLSGADIVDGDAAAHAAETTAIWLEEPADATVAPAVEWLSMLPLSREPGQHPVGASYLAGSGREWWMHANAPRMMAFADAWDRRPPGVTFFGTDRVRRLLMGARRVAPRVRVTASGLDWFAVSAEWEAEGLALTDSDLERLRASTSRFVRLPSGWVRRDVVDEHEHGAAVLADLGVEAGSGEQRITLWQLAGARPETLRSLAELGGSPESVQAVERLRAAVARFDGLPEVAPPPGLRAALRPYQQRGLDFLAYVSSLGLGAVLADDMGLGKTVQALAWIEHLRAGAPDAGPVLVVCPASVVHNWAREAARFVPGLRVLLLTSGKERHELRQKVASHDLVVTNYALLRRDLEEWKRVALRALVLDEAQNIKNPDAAVTRAAAALDAPHRLALTGTPLENRALDLWSIVDVLNPGYLGVRARFSARFDRLDAPPHARALLAARLRPVLLRRMKHEVATDLPERIEERRDCELSAEQRRLYLAELRRSRKLVDRLGNEPDGIRRNKITILAALTRLRQVCCHPALAGGAAGAASGKFDALAELLDPLLAEGHKVLLFSQFVRCLRLLERDLERRGIAYHVLTGQTVRRERVVSAFTEDVRPCVFLISLKAGGTGLNLTAASYVVLFDPWWNPAVEAQAIDRTHRIGQHRTVIAYRLLTRATIEEKIWELQQRKAALVRDVLGEDGFARGLTRDDLGFLLADA